MNFKKYFRLWMKNLSLELQTELMYRANFIIKIISILVSDVVGPLITLLIYSTTSGIPGWTFEEFILFQGSFILVFGIGRSLYWSFPGTVIEAIKEGSFDKFMVRPFPPLAQLSLGAWKIEGFAGVLVGLILVIWSSMRIGIQWQFVPAYILIVVLANVFMYSLMILIAALAFLVVNSWALYDVLFRLSDFGRYPTEIYTGLLRFFLTFIFPIGIVAFYPAKVLLGRVSGTEWLAMVIPVLGVFVLSLFLWLKAMKKYTSAGG